jgi:hypothetical protein
MHPRLVAQEPKIHGIAEQAVAGSGPADEVSRHVDPGEDAVQAGQHQVGDNDPERDQQQRLPARLYSLFQQQVGQPHR